MKMIFDQIFFCAGARNHDLLNIFGKQTIKFEYDERMASFKALGLSKMVGTKVAICTTSGTAVAQCVPAMLEAFYSELPLVLITGDRPKKLHGTGSPQTIEHEALTRACRRTYIEVSIEELRELDLNSVEYPVHINVLVDDTVEHRSPTHFHQNLEGFKRFLSDKKKPLFVFSHENRSMRLFVEKFSKLKLTFYAETLSCAHDLSDIKTEKKLLELFNANYFDSIIRVGHTPLTKIWRLLEKKTMPVFSFDSRNLSGLSYGEVLPVNSEELLTSKDFWSALETLSPYPVADETLWKLENLIKKFPQAEISTMSRLQEVIDENSLVYLGNSLVVRFFELTQLKNFTVHGNRGVNGIDGQLATAIGVAMGTNEHVTCILGDLTTFYDLSSLREIPDNLTLVIINNQGGRIFDMLNLDQRIILEHEHDFKNICEGMKISYGQELSDYKKVKVLELFPDRDQSQSFLKEWNK